jgi:hypothetical protein
MAEKLDPRELAVASQMRAEIAASQWKKIATFVRALNDAGVPTDYTSFFLRVSGKKPMPTSVLLSALDLLDLDYLTFIGRAMRRAEG